MSLETGKKKSYAKIRYSRLCMARITGREMRARQFWPDGMVCEKAKALLYALGCLPVMPPYTYPGVAFYANNGASERIAFRGGRWGQGMNAGLFKTCLDDPRTYSGDAVGFRSAYYEI